MGMIIAVIGAGEADARTSRLAAGVGAELARKGVMLVCGGLSGVMEAACEGAHGEGGLTIGILPGDSPVEANQYVDIAIPTGMGIARNVLVVKTGEAVIALDGKHGTLSEIAIALDLGKPVISLGEWKLPKSLGKDIIVASEPADAAAKAIRAATKAATKLKEYSFEAAQAEDPEEGRMENEVQAYLAEFNTLRAEIRKALQGLSDDAANWQPLSKDSNSIYALITHLTGAQSNWMKRVIAGIPIQRDREAEFKASGSLPEALKAWEAIDREADSIMAKLALKQLDETREASGPYGRVTVRWCILHQISHYATHLGHIQITRQLWDQQHA